MFESGSTARERFTRGDIALVLCWSFCCWHRPLIPGISALRKPSFSALVMFHVSEASALGAGKAEVEFLHVLVFPQRSGVAVEHDASGLQNVAIRRKFQRDIGVLLGKEK